MDKLKIILNDAELRCIQIVKAYKIAIIISCNKNI